MRRYISCIFWSISAIRSAHASISSLMPAGNLGQYRTNELVRRRMNFSSDAMADFEGLLEVNRKICQQQMAEKASPTLPTNCAVLPLILPVSLCSDFYIKKCRAISAWASCRQNFLLRRFQNRWFSPCKYGGANERRAVHMKTAPSEDDVERCSSENF